MMTHQKLYRRCGLWVCGLVAVLATSCDKVPANGSLDGMWQLMSIETPNSTRDVKTDGLYLSFQLQMTYWSQLAHSDNRFYSHFTHTGDSIFFFDICRPAAHSKEDPDDHPLTSAEMAEGAMDVWGIHTMHTRYRVQTLKSDALVLEKADTTLRFRKF